MEEPEDNANVKSGDGEDMREATATEVSVNIGGEFGAFTEGHGSDRPYFGLADTDGLHFFDNVSMHAQGTIA